MRHSTQDPKYGIENNRLVNMATGEPIPAEEPVFLFRAKDLKAAGALRRYAELCENPEQARIVVGRAEQFEGFAKANPGRMKEPDTAKPEE